WLPLTSKADVLSTLKQLRIDHPSQIVVSKNPFSLPKKLWKRLTELTSIDGGSRTSEMSNELLLQLTDRLKSDNYEIKGKTTNKEEFVTCGGVTLDEVDFKTMASKRCQGLYFAGEILDIDGVTGGFNFQSAWTTGWIAGKAAIRMCKIIS